MTYCVAMLLDAGLVFLSDSRTNAGVDQINTFRKTTVFERPASACIVLHVRRATSPITQGVAQPAGASASGAHDDGRYRTCYNCPNLFEAARCVGDALREMHQRDGEALQHAGRRVQRRRSSSAARSRARRRACSMIYAAGNFVEATPDTPYFQIGESKYGKPIIDRVIRRSMPLSEAAKCALISMDSTIRSNLSVGLPLDLVIVRRDECSRSAATSTSTTTNEYFQRSASAGARRCARYSPRCRTRTGSAAADARGDLPRPLSSTHDETRTRAAAWRRPCTRIRGAARGRPLSRRAG